MDDEFVDRNCRDRTAVAMLAGPGWAPTYAGGRRRVNRNRPPTPEGGSARGKGRSEDGFLYALNPDGTFRKRIFLQPAIGAAYTPLSIGPGGIIYTQNAGRLFAIGAR